MRVFSNAVFMHGPKITGFAVPEFESKSMVNPIAYLNSEEVRVIDGDKEIAVIKLTKPEWHSKLRALVSQRENPEITVAQVGDNGAFNDIWEMDLHLDEPAFG